MATTSSKKETFRVLARGATQVQLIGEFTNWQERPIPMIKGVDSAWRATVILPQGRHEYLFVVDGKLSEDPDCTERVPNSTGGFNMVRVVELPSF
jgi:1,4-alpha-glucan branching enzyme